MEFITTKIEGVKLFKLNEIQHERGVVLRMMRSDFSEFKKFGEIYFSFINKSNVKVLKRHLSINQFLTVPIGMVAFQIRDERSNSPTNGQIDKILIGMPNKYYLLKIPPMVWYGFESLEEYSLIANCTDGIHNPQEVERIELENSRDYTC